MNVETSCFKEWTCIIASMPCKKLTCHLDYYRDLYASSKTDALFFLTSVWLWFFFLLYINLRRCLQSRLFKLFFLSKACKLGFCKIETLLWFFLPESFRFLPFHLSRQPVPQRRGHPNSDRQKKMRRGRATDDRRKYLPAWSWNTIYEQYEIRFWRSSLKEQNCYSQRLPLTQLFLGSPGKKNVMHVNVIKFRL